MLLVIKANKPGQCLFVYLPRLCNPYLRPQEYKDNHSDLMTAQAKFEELLNWANKNLRNGRFLYMNFYDFYRLQEQVWFNFKCSPRKLIQ